MDINTLLKSRTVWGAIVAVVGYLASPAGLDLIAKLTFLPAWVPAVVIAVGTILGTVGLRSAVEKSGPTTPPAP